MYLYYYKPKLLLYEPCAGINNTVIPTAENWCKKNSGAKNYYYG